MKNERQTHSSPENPETVMVKMFEATPEDRKATLRSRARRLAQEVEKKGEAQEYIEVLAFLLAHEKYAIETQFIRKVYPLTELTPLPCTPDYVFGIINIRGQILTIIDMKKFFDLPEKGITNLNRVIIVREGDMKRKMFKYFLRMGILADEINGIRNIPKSDLNQPLPTMSGIHAGYIKGVTGEGIILLDMKRFLNDRQLIIHEEVGE